MRHSVFATCLAASAVTLSACARDGASEVDRALQDLSVIEDSNMTDVMLTVADPAEAVSYFTRAAAANPERIDLQRGLAASLIRAGQATQGAAAWRDVTEHPEATDLDRVNLAGAQIRNNDWDAAEATLNAIPPTVETFDRYRYEAMVADANEQWDRADSFYETALGLTTTPAGVLNNWGYSMLTRGNYQRAERLFGDALRHDPTMFTAKNNLVMARGAQGNYTLPVIPMTQIERAQLLYTLALTAIKQDDLTIGRNLLAEAVETHPQYFEEAALALEALDAG